MIKFKTLKYRNFLSTGNQFIELQLDRSPTTLITGGNGSGKSTMMDALFFSLFNKPFRNIKKNSLVNSINNGSLETDLTFSVGKKEYRIIRGIKPAKFEIYEDSVLLAQDAATKDYQKYLEDIILCGLNEKVFKQVVVIGSADYQPFMQLRTSDRREVIEELLDITIFSEMLSIVKENLSSFKGDLTGLDYKIIITKDAIALRKEAAKKQKIDVKKKKASIQLLIAKEKEDILYIQEATKKENTNRDIHIQKLTGAHILDNTISDLQKLLRDLKRTELQANNKITFFSENNNCPTCVQDIKNEHKDALVGEAGKKLNDVSDAIERITNELEKKESSKKIYTRIKSQLDVADKNIIINESKITTHKKLISHMEKEIANLNIGEVNGPTECSSLESTLINDTKDRIVLLEHQEYYSVVSSMLKDGGIKAKIIKQYIPIMNKVINEYLIRLGLPIEFTLDENFDEVIKSRFRDSFQYNNFSEGEKQRINIALLLAWRQIAKGKNTTNTNLLIFDETFDASLDASATEELLNMLLEIEDTNIFIISHKSDLSDKLRSHIEFEKNGNFTNMKLRPD